MKQLLGFLFFSLLFLACNENKLNKVLERKMLQEHHTTIQRSMHQMFLFSAVTDGSCKNCTYILDKKKSDTLYVYDFDKKQIVSKLALPKELGRITDFIVSKDTMYSILNAEFTIGAMGLQPGSELKLYTSQNPKYMAGFYLSKVRDGLHVNIMSNKLINTKEIAADFFTHNVDALIRLEDDTIHIIKKSINYPQKYLKNTNLDFTGFNMANSPEYEVFSFTQSPEVVVRNSKGEIFEKRICSNSFIQSPDIPEDKMFDYNYINNLKYSKFSHIYYNPYRKEFYRLVRHPLTTINKKPFYKAWSLIVTDGNLNTKYEIPFEEGGQYVSHKIVPTKDGYAVVVFSGDIDKKEELIFHEYKLD